MSECTPCMRASVLSLHTPPHPSPAPTHLGLEQPDHKGGGQHSPGLAHLQGQLDGGQCRGDVLGTGWTDDHRDHTHKEAGMKGNNEVQTWRRDSGRGCGEYVHSHP